jgi:hypothetical protein
MRYGDGDDVVLRIPAALTMRSTHKPRRYLDFSSSIAASMLSRTVAVYSQQHAGRRLSAWGSNHSSRRGKCSLDKR